MPSPETARKLIHIPGGLVPAGFVFVFGWTGSVIIALFLLAYVLAAWEASRRGIQYPIVGALIDRTNRRTGETPLGGIEFLVAVVALGILFPLPYFLGAMALLAVGDGVAALAGRRWGKRPLPWNPAKTWVGLVAGTITGAAAFIAFAVLGGQMQQAGFVDAGPILGANPTWPAFAFILLGFASFHWLAAAPVILMRRPRKSNANTLQVLGAFAVALAPALAFALVSPLFLRGPVLPTLGGHGPTTQLLLALVPVPVMLAESALRRHDNLVVPGLAAFLAYLVVALGALV